MRESARVSALEEEANLVLGNFSELEDALVDQKFDSLLRRFDDGVSLEDLLEPGEEDVGHVRPARDVVKAVLDEAWRADRMAWLCDRFALVRMKASLTIFRLSEYSRRYYFLPRCTFIPSSSE